ncbi:MAG: hypothetical protein QF441_15540 [Bacteriovoracaceae bacterium]|jgi:hypothetical protein|nr:hypothetical protein [Bacteriovoracaceae bacterium]|tara:strand:+ start:506 stop:1021 length:516 start_codon:yes stop_codon:yes gene_type:complete
MKSLELKYKSIFRFDERKKVFYIEKNQLINFLNKIKRKNMIVESEVTIVFRDDKSLNPILLDYIIEASSFEFKYSFLRFSKSDQCSGIHFFKNKKIIFFSNVIDDFDDKTLNVLHKLYGQVESRVIFVHLLEESVSEAEFLWMDYYYSQNLPDTMAISFKNNKFQYIHLGV